MQEGAREIIALPRCVLQIYREMDADDSGDISFEVHCNRLLSRVSFESIQTLTPPPPSHTAGVYIGAGALRGTKYRRPHMPGVYIDAGALTGRC